MLLQVISLGLLFLAVAPPAPAANSEEGFVPIFNGKDLTGWEGKPGWWYVEDGAITAESTPKKPCKQCNYLMWRGGKPADFELRCSYRLVGGNSGIQFRSQERPNFDTYGYQADMDAEHHYTGCLYEHARGCITQRGEKVTIDEKGKKNVVKVGDSKELAKHLNNGEWGEYRVIARGNEITLIINGVVMSQVTDRDAKHAAAGGILALQMHPGPPMKVQFKDLRIKEFPKAESNHRKR